MKKIALVVLCLAFLFINPSFNAYAHDLIMDFDKIKTSVKNKFKKKQEEKPKMPETREEWEKEAQNVPLEERELKNKEPEIDTKKFNIPEVKYTFEVYNYPQGSRELNFEDVKTKLFYYSYLVADKSFHYAAYSHYYYSPDSNQITSNFFVEKLDTSKTKTKRILDYKHKQLERNPILSSGLKETYQDYFSGLTLVDWSKDSTKLLIKEKIGSTRNGVYKTNLYVHFLETDVEAGYTIELDDLYEAIKNYYLDFENRQIVKYRYDIIPLGFSEENDNLVVVLCFAYDNDGNKVLLGVWGYNCETREIILLSSENIIPKISANGIFLKQTFN